MEEKHGGSVVIYRETSSQDLSPMIGFRREWNPVTRFLPTRTEFIALWTTPLDSSTADERLAVNSSDCWKIKMSSNWKSYPVGRLIIRMQAVYNLIDPWNLIRGKTRRTVSLSESGRERGMGDFRCSRTRRSGVKIVPINQGPLSFAQEEFNRPFIPLPW